MSQAGIVLAFNPKQHSYLTLYLAAIHASCITQDQAIATFLPPLSHEKLLKWWKERIAEVNDGKRLIWILVTEVDASGKPRGSEVMGVVMLSTPFSETGAFRGYVEKLLVHRNFRGRGGAKALMEALENEAANMGRSVLLLDTEADSVAEAVFRKLGYVETGRVPRYGMSPTGELKDVEPVLSRLCEAKLDRAKDSCCVETYGGLPVATQPRSTLTGLEDRGQIYPRDEWSIHGLWPGEQQEHTSSSARKYWQGPLLAICPDFCNGTALSG
ncbi:Acyl-CoA N-acyltransferase [Metarhizium album ARSEF 1941]|uniref:Acyl-CoA N-acyltransferase n=1 Tax=Metarhizium album (strain ARSEF 1941) TaxID=1081103 RepID=A0A0B2WX44_METAS|nr:Acyl-CoA N-acyltransferase [Metarhizium album ARSEF 1941]KHN98164.1 Acyl-CoA N-acyltransferase [Metarhizium album ARSEF 1941]